MACPLLYLGLSLSAGIGLGFCLSPAPAIPAIGLLTCLAASWPAYFLKKNTLSLALALLATALLGAGAYAQADKDYSRNALRKLDFSGYADFVGRLYRSPSLGAGRTTLFLRVEDASFQGKKTAARGNLRVSVLHPSAYPSPLELKTGDRVKVSAQFLSARGFRNFGGTGTADLRKKQKIHAQAVSKSVRLIEKLPEPARLSPAHLVSSLRLTIERRIEAHFSSPDRSALSRQGAVLEALLLGERGRMDKETTSGLQRSGLYHLIAISGAHIGIISWLLLSILRAVRFPRRPSYGVLMLFLLFYAMIVEGRASVMRATIMALTYLWGKLLWEKPHILNTVSFSALVILLLNPFSLFEPGFEMTYAATLSIILFYPRVSKYLSRLPLKTGELLALSLTAQLGVIPLVAHLFHRVTLSSLLLNIPAIPLVGLIMGSGFAFLVVSPVSAGLAALLAPGIKALIDVFLWISRSLDCLPAFSYRIPAPPPAFVLGYYLFLLLILLRPRFKRQRALVSGLFFVFLAVLITYPFPARSSPSLRVTVLDVGQGDSILVEFPGKKKMLVDGGGTFDSNFDIGEQVVSPFLWRCGIKKLDYVVLTHAHPDHLNGLVAAARNFRIGEFWEAFSPAKSPAYEDLQRALSKSTLRRRVFRGFSIREGPLLIEALHPEESVPLTRKAENDDSLALRLTANGISILLAADIGRASEQDIVGRGLAVRSQVLKSPHHGSRTSSSPAFLAAVDPRVVVVSAGRGGSYGVLHPEVLKRYEAAGRIVFRTDLDGAVEITVQSPGLRIRTAASNPPP
ncbi:MAG: DNA internalization-related competence protein ComEC/Rec2 [Candidatus Aminicenantes bacterium]|nr:DNA internalization-related competence protein ComEC/Rec2 [Candidatus Aminicenantes bacterium]